MNSNERRFRGRERWSESELVFPAALVITLIVIYSSALTTTSASPLSLASKSSNITLELFAKSNLNSSPQTDAPKFYHLNELLHKSTDPKDSPQAAALPSLGNGSGAQSSGNENLRPLDGAPASRSRPIKPRGMRAESDGNEDDDGSIESLLRAMRGRSGGEMAIAPQGAGRTNGARNKEQDFEGDEATIQRKSSLDGDESNRDALDKGPNRSDKLAANRVENNNIPRRKRRASPRQAPPKLKSRRVSRNSRRRKLRHGIKPKRRA